MRLLFGILAVAGCMLIKLIFGLMRAGRRADEGEQKILEAMRGGPDDGENSCS